MKNGFTLIELVVVILLLAVLSVTVIPRLGNTSDFERAAQRDQLLSLFRVVQQRAMQNTQANTCHRVTFVLDNIGLNKQNEDGTCAPVVSGESPLIIDDEDETIISDYLIVTDIDSYFTLNSDGDAFTQLTFDRLGRPSVDVGSCTSSGCRVNLGDFQICIESEGYVRDCT